jgi:hypothetical protein
MTTDNSPSAPALPKPPEPSYAYEYIGKTLVFSIDETTAHGLACYEAGRASVASVAVPEPLAIGFSPMWLAPIDGTPVLLHMPTCGDKFAVGQFHSDGPDTIHGNWGDDEGNYYVHAPVGWMGLHVLEKLAAAPAALVAASDLPQAAPEAGMWYATSDVVIASGTGFGKTQRLLLAGEPFTFAAPLQADAPKVAEVGQVEASDDGLVAAFPHIALGHGLVEIGDATWEGLPALFFGKNGAEVGPIGSKRVRDNLAQDGETLALITFANLKGLEQVEDALSRVRRNMEASQGEAQ